MTIPVNIADQFIKLMSDASYYNGYSRFNDDLGRQESFDEAVDRVIEMHAHKYMHVMTSELMEKINFARQAYKDKLVLGAQRALQFGGEQILKHESRMYNCSASYLDRPEFFGEAMYLLLSGCGVGFSVQKHHVAKLPKITAPQGQSVTFKAHDSIEGWADCFNALFSSYMASKRKAPFASLVGTRIHFDLSSIRPEGSHISGGFKAPGPEPLAKALEKCRAVLDAAVEGQSKPLKLRPIQAYDFVMHQSDAVLAGGVRRAATIAIFSLDDEEMMNAKTGNWYSENPQRARSNNSVLLIRGEVSRKKFHEIKKSTREFGEPGFIWADDHEFLFNPCVEIGMRGYTWNMRSGFQFCNLVEINGAACKTEADFKRATEAAAILGTLQAGYTNFKYISKASKEITEREALLGCSITGWMNNPEILFNEETLKAGANHIKEINKKVAAMLGINPAARTTCVKPSGNASVLLGTASGIHAEHAPLYIRNIELNRNSEVLKKITETNPAMVAPHNTKPNDFVVSFPIAPPATSIFKDDMKGTAMLKKVQVAQRAWVNAGKDETLCVDSRLSNNVSNTVTVDDWDEVFDYIFDHQHDFAGVSLMSEFGDKAFEQAPFTAAFTMEQMTDYYGLEVAEKAFILSDSIKEAGLSVWQMVSKVMFAGHKPEDEPATTALYAAMAGFSQRYFSGDIRRAGDAIKDAFIAQHIEAITQSFVPIKFDGQITEKKTIDANTMGAAACAGGACTVEI